MDLGLEMCDVRRYTVTSHSMPISIIHHVFYLSQTSKYYKPFSAGFKEYRKLHFTFHKYTIYRGADKSLTRSGRKQASVSLRTAWISFGALPCRGIKNLMTARVSMLLKSRACLTCLRGFFFPGRAKDLSAPRYRTFPHLTNMIEYYTNYNLY